MARKHSFGDERPSEPVWLGCKWRGILSSYLLCSQDLKMKGKSIEDSEPTVAQLNQQCQRSTIDARRQVSA